MQGRGRGDRGGGGLRSALPAGVGFCSRIDGCDFFFHVPRSPSALAARCSVSVQEDTASYIIRRGVEVRGGGEGWADVAEGGSL